MNGAQSQITRHPARALLLLALAGVAAAVVFGFATGGTTRLALDGYLVADGTSRLFVLLINFVFLGVSNHVLAQPGPHQEHATWRFALLVAGFMVLSNLAVVSNHLLGMWVFLEATALLATPLILVGREPGAHAAAWRYFLFSAVGLGLAALGFGCMGRGAEATNISPDLFANVLEAHASEQTPDAWHRVGLVLLVLGFGTKLGLAPMFVWLPDTYQNATPPVTALLAAVQFNVALVALVRVIGALRAMDPTLMTNVLMAMGLTTMVMSAAGLIVTTNYKRLIAYASLNHGGVIAVGLGMGRDASYGVMLYVVSNAIIKAILFLTAGRIQQHYRTQDVRQVSGLFRALPYSGGFFMVGIFALLGLPPFGSFLGELIILSELIRLGYFGVFVGFCATLTVAFVGMARAAFPMIWGEPPSLAMQSGIQQRFHQAIPKLLLLGFLVAMGLYLPPPVTEMFRQVAHELGGP